MNVSFVRKIAGKKIVSIKYRKKNGEVSVMACRFHVTKGVKGVGASYNAEERNYAVVYKMNGKKSGFRTVIVDNIIEVRVRGRVYSKMDLVIAEAFENYKTTGQKCEENIHLDQRDVDNLFAGYFAA